MVCGLAAAGEDGVLRALELIEDEMTRAVGLLGVTSLDQLGPSHVKAAAPVVAPDVFSAFPLLRLPEQRY